MKRAIYLLFVLILTFALRLPLVDCFRKAGNDNDHHDDTDVSEDNDAGDNDTISDDDNDTTSNNDEIFEDTKTNYAWQIEPSESSLDWSNALSYCINLTLGNHYDWRMPSIDELRSLIRGCDTTESAGSCRVSGGCLSSTDCQDSSCDGCSGNAGPANGCYWPDKLKGNCGWYWSSSTCSNHTDWAWGIDFPWAYVGHEGKNGHYRTVRCVRDL